MESWYEDNQRHLMAALTSVRERLQQNLSGSNHKNADQSNLYFTNADPLNVQQEAVTEQTTGQTEMSAPPSLENICSIFGLTSFERDILMMCAGMELDGAFAAVCSAAQRYQQRPYPSFGLAMEHCQKHFGALLRLLHLYVGGDLSKSSLVIP